MKSHSAPARSVRPRKSAATSDGRSEKTKTENGRRKEILFQVNAPSAGTVSLAADFTGWDKAPLRMLSRGDGKWQIKVALPRGRHCYKFLVDGRWVDDPHSPERVANAFGTTDGVINVL